MPLPLITIETVEITYKLTFDFGNNQLQAMWFSGPKNLKPGLLPYSRGKKQLLNIISAKYGRPTYPTNRRDMCMTKCDSPVGVGARVYLELEGIEEHVREGLRRRCYAQCMAYQPEEIQSEFDSSPRCSLWWQYAWKTSNTGKQKEIWIGYKQKQIKKVDIASPVLKELDLKLLKDIEELREESESSDIPKHYLQWAVLK